MNINEIVLSRDEDVRELATRIGKDIGGVNNLTTTAKESVVAAINEIKTATDEAGDIYATKEETSKLASKTELTQAITDLINGADADSDTLKELADKITALAQADNGLVSAIEAQEFTEEQKAQARSNIEAASTGELEAQKEDLLEDIATATAPLATKEELEAKADKAPEGDEYALVSSLPDLVAPYATKDEVAQAFNDLGINAGGDYVSAYLQASQQTGE